MFQSFKKVFSGTTSILENMGKIIFKKIALNLYITKMFIIITYIIIYNWIYTIVMLDKYR